MGEVVLALLGRLGEKLMQNHHQWLKKFGRDAGDKVHDEITEVATIMTSCETMAEFRTQLGSHPRISACACFSRELRIHEKLRHQAFAQTAHDTQSTRTYAFCR